jgi:hypothetical protein
MRSWYRRPFHGNPEDIGIVRWTTHFVPLQRCEQSDRCFMVEFFDICPQRSLPSRHNAWQAKMFLLTEARSVAKPLERLKESIKMSQVECLLVVSGLGILS